MFFPKFPSTKLQDVNLDWILKKLSAFRGGSTNQVLAKASNADFDFKWVTGSGGDTSDYNDLVNQPQINNVTLVGNKSASDLSLLDSSALAPYRTAATQDVIDAAKQAKITASGLLKGDGNGGVSAATAGTDYLDPAALAPYRTAAAQNAIDAGMAKIEEIGIVITGARPSRTVTAGQYVIVRNSTISGITDGLYTAVNALSQSTDVIAADLSAVSVGGLNSIANIVRYSNVNITNVHVGVVLNRCQVVVRNGIVTCSLAFEVTSAINYDTILFTLPVYPTTEEINGIGVSNVGGNAFAFYCDVNGNIKCRDSLGVAAWIQCVFTFMI